MQENLWPRGSEWRKWDLHVHTPASANYSGDYNGLVIQLGNSDCAAIGINDYFSVDGYRELQRRLSAPSPSTDGNAAYREALERLKSKTLFPVVECRMTNILVDRSWSGPRINFHIIFDTLIDPENIEVFIKSLQVKGSSIGSSYSDKQFLLEHVSVDFHTVCKQLASDGNFAGRYLILLPWNEYGGADKVDPKSDKMFKENLVCNSHIIGSANAKQIDFFLWKDQRFTEEDYHEWFGCRKPCIKGSDSHDQNEEVGKLKDDKSQPTNRYCWIKADPTFNGLRQIINEPEDRVFIGAVPPKSALVHDEPTRFIDRIVIRKRNDADTTDIWFDCEIPLSSDLITIIGNKGSGKSALADILGLAGNAQTDEDCFSFLSKQRFRARNGRLARQFEARLYWRDGTHSEVSLANSADPNAVEKVRYVPQTYLEKVCTETEPGAASQFQVELRKVIFSHITEANRLGKGTLDELLAYKTEEIEEQIDLAKRDVQASNRVLVRLEEQKSPAHKAQLQSGLLAKQAELNAHVANKPLAVGEPNAIPAEQKAAFAAIQAKIATERAKLLDFETQITNLQQALVRLSEQIAATRKVEGKLDTIRAEFRRLEREMEADLAAIPIAFADLVTLTVRIDIVSGKRDELEAQKSAAERALAEDNPEALPRLKQMCLQAMETLQSRLVLLCHKLSILADALATGASVELSGKKLCDHDPDGGDGVFHVAFRPDWRSLVGGSFWV